MDTRKQSEIILALIQGISIKEIAKIHEISPQEVKSIVKHPEMEGICDASQKTAEEIELTALQTLEEIMKDRNCDAKVRLGAAQTILDRGSKSNKKSSSLDINNTHTVKLDSLVIDLLDKAEQAKKQLVQDVIDVDCKVLQ